MGHLVAQKIEWRGKSESRFWRFSYTNNRKQPKTTLLWQITSRQPCGVRRQVSPFWKEDIQGYNMCEKQENQKNFGRPPLSPRGDFACRWWHEITGWCSRLAYSEQKNHKCWCHVVLHACRRLNLELFGQLLHCQLMTHLFFDSVFYVLRVLWSSIWGLDRRFG